MKLKLSAIPLLLATSIQAHHSFSSEYAMETPLRLEGILTRIEFTNPHAHFYLDVKTPDGGTITWIIEAGSPNGLRSRGFTKSTAAEGMHVIFNGYPSRTTTHKAVGREITLPGGETFRLIR